MYTVDIAKVKAAVAKLKEINWLCGNVKPDDVDSAMKEKVSDKDDYSAGLQAPFAT